MESLLGLVAQKIVFALASETTVHVSFVERLQLQEANKAMARIKSEFEHMRTFISNMDPQKYTITVEPWLQRAREIAYKMEDIIDEYLYISTLQSQRRLPSITINVYFFSWGAGNTWRFINEQLKDIANDLSHLTEMKVRYDISKLQTKEGDASSSFAGRLPVITDIIPDEDDIVNKQKGEDLIGWLTDGRSELQLISIYGLGGMGKTFMVHKVYSSKIVDSHFDCKCWVPISKSYKTEQVLTVIYKGLCKELLGKERESIDDTFQSDAMSLVKKVSRFVEGRKYLIIFDDVWNAQAYYDVKSALPDNDRGSRIVITTRSPDVASLANEVYRMRLSELDTEESRDLFCRYAFWQDKDKSVPGDLINITSSILGKCQGLPLAIVSIARLLSLKKRNEQEWISFYEKLNWEFADNQSLKEVKNVVMNTSYDDLPSHLKNCFLHCSMFSDYGIKRNKLIRLWIAESFVQGRGTHTMEDVAEEYLKELVHRSMMHVIERNSLGRVKSCRMHNLMRDLTLEKARTENFSFVWKNSEASHPGNGARRLSIDENVPNSNLLGMDFFGARSLLVLNCGSSPLMNLLKSISSRAKYLRIVDLDSAEIDKIPDAFTNLFNLHYLGLERTKIKLLPDSIGKLRNLQTLDVRYTGIEKLPKGISQLKNMRHLLTFKFNWKSDDSDNFYLHSFWCLKAPEGIWNLTSLQHLDMAVDEASVGRLGNLTQLRKLRLSHVRETHFQKLSESIIQMPALSNLWIIAENENEVLQLQNLHNILQNLHKLYLHGRLLTPTAVDETRRNGQSVILRVKARVRVAALLISRLRSKIAATTAIWRRKRQGGRGMISGDAKHVNYFKLKRRVFSNLQGNLRELCLSSSGLQKDPLPRLGTFLQLRVLRLEEAYDGAVLCFKNGWFPQLKDLRLMRLLNLRRIIFQKGSLASLEFLWMERLLEMEMVPQGIEHLTSIRRLHLSECNPIFIHEIKEDRRDSVASITRIMYRHQVDGEWFYKDLSRSNAEEQQPLISQGEEITAAEAPEDDSPVQVMENEYSEHVPEDLAGVFPSSDVHINGGESGDATCNIEPAQQQDDSIAELKSELEEEKNKMKLVMDLVSSLYSAGSMAMPPEFTTIFNNQPMQVPPADIPSSSQPQLYNDSSSISPQPDENEELF